MCFPWVPLHDLSTKLWLIPTVWRSALSLSGNASEGQVAVSVASSNRKKNEKKNWNMYSSSSSSRSLSSLLFFAADLLTAFAVIVVFVKGISCDIVSRSRFPLAGNFVSREFACWNMQEKTERVLIGRWFYMQCGWTTFPAHKVRETIYKGGGKALHPNESSTTENAPDQQPPTMFHCGHPQKRDKLW